MKPMQGNKSSTIVLIAIMALLLSCNQQSELTRENIPFNSNWKFELSDQTDFKLAGFEDAAWRELNLPHDWSIEGNFDEQAPAGIGGGALPGGVGWYRKSFNLPSSDTAKRVYITFDGVYQNSEVYINGNLLGKRPNGYITFQYDLTPYLNFGDMPNVIAVRVDNGDQPNSRWYSGSGIYRNVWLLKTNSIHIDLWGTHITTPLVSESTAEVEVSIAIKNTTNSIENLEIETKFFDPSNKLVAKHVSSIEVKQNSTSEVLQKMIVNTPELWSIEHPNLYKAINTVKLNNVVIDVYETTFGLRFFEYSSINGFILNGKQVKIKGVCNHHDLGALGAAVNSRAIERQLEILKEMGCNGIRTSHNPPSPELLQFCDKMGFIVMNETFDMWKKKKVENDYSKYWDEWHVKDLTDHLLRDRNHPSIFSWSIGNEILEQWDTTGIQIARDLTSIVKQYAPNMPVTSGCNDPEPHNNIIKSGALDLIGYNYKHEAFEQFHQKFPGQKFIATETTSSLNSRGVYNMPADSVRIWPKQWDIPFHEGNPDNSCSSYDNCRAPWGSTHEDTWKIIKRNDYLAGMYIWTSFDYLGEPTPYLWPSRSSYFGIIDLAGFPKDIYYMYQSEWTDKQVLHLFPHWNWNEGQTVDVWAYTNFTEVELFLNDKSLGKKSKLGEELHLQWQVPYVPGILKAIGKNEKGDTKQVEINTAGTPAKIKLEADRTTINADGVDLSFVTVTILDKDNNIVPYANNLVHFELNNMATITAVDNGLQTSMESFKANFRKANNGKCLVILQSGELTGVAKLTAKSEGLQDANLEIKIN
jgi:beta-galactosidase